VNEKLVNTGVGTIGTASLHTQADAYLAAVVATSSDAIVSKALDGTVTSWNESAERIFGYQAEEIVGRNIRLLIPPELQAEEDDFVSRLREGGYIDHYETVRIRKDGRRVDVSLSISPIKNESGEVIGAAKIARDITTRKQADEYLKATTAKFESVFNQSGIFAAILDLDGNLLEINDFAIEASGYTREEVLGQSFWSTPWWRGSKDVQARIRWASGRVAAGGRFRESIYYWVASGAERIFDFAMHPIRGEMDEVRFIYSAGVDVTQRTRAQEALLAREAEEREIAVGLQRALLPGKLVAPPGISVAAQYEAASAALEVGGDWYDVVPLPDGRVGVTVGDVVGHGLAAAAVMGQLRTALAALAPHSESPGDLLTRLDAFVATTDTDFATVCYGVLDVSTGTFEYASAGHLPILLIPPGNEPRWLSEAQSPPLYGEEERGLRPHATETVEPGSLIVCYSDGLIERRGELLTEGLDRLKHAGRSLLRLPLDDVCSHLVKALGVDQSREDDVAVLAVRFDSPVRTRFHRAFPAEAGELRKLRAAIRSWLEERQVDQSTQNALLIAVGEACANAVEHAYHDSPRGEVRVDIEQRPDRMLEATVQDFGRFRPPAKQDPDRGHGTRIIGELTADFSSDSTSTGTTVRFRLPAADLRVSA